MWTTNKESTQQILQWKSPPQPCHSKPRAVEQHSPETNGTNVQLHIWQHVHTYNIATPLRLDSQWLSQLFSQWSNNIFRFNRCRVNWRLQLTINRKPKFTTEWKMENLGSVNMKIPYREETPMITSNVQIIALGAPSEGFDHCSSRFNEYV